MTTYHFEIVLESGAFGDADADRVFAAGADDATPVTRGGVTRLAFDRDAESLEDAIRSAINDVRSAGCAVDRIEMSAPDVAQQAG